MRSHKKLKFQLLVTFALFLAGCSQNPEVSLLTAQGELPTVRSANTNVQLFAYVPSKKLFAVYAAHSNGSTTPERVVQGAHTMLKNGFGGIVVAADGTAYVLDGRRAQLLAFKKASEGNVKPFSVETLPRHTFGGITLDGQGNFWSADVVAGTMDRFPTNKGGSIKPSATIKPVLETPLGLLSAFPTTVALDRQGHLYCACVTLYQGRQAAGVTEYDVADVQRPKLIRSFYDFELPEDPPQVLAIDAETGKMFLASPEYRTGIFAYPQNTPSGEVSNAQHIAGPHTTVDNVAALATDMARNLYVATATGVSVFPLNASGDQAPKRRIIDAARLSWSIDDYGHYLDLH